MPDVLELRVQVVVTPAGVVLEPVASSGPNTAAAVAAAATQDLAARVLRLQHALLALPQPGSESRADPLVRHAPMWDSTELEGFQAAASRVGGDTATVAAQAVTNLKYLSDRVQEVRATNPLFGYNWERFNWHSWHFHLAEADDRLKRLAEATAGIQ
jgi:hypothetical protein